MGAYAPKDAPMSDPTPHVDPELAKIAYDIKRYLECKVFDGRGCDWGYVENVMTRVFRGLVDE